MQVDVAVVGAGIVGLAHAWSAAKRGLRVAVLERSARAEGASIRNFGMIWPVGQPDARYESALRSRAAWLELGREAGLWVRESGSLHLAHRIDELAVMEEAAQAWRSRGARMRTADETCASAPGARPHGLLAALWSPAELAVDPREAVARLAAWLAEKFGVDFRFGAAVSYVESGRLLCADGTEVRAERIFACPGAELDRLFPRLLSAETGLRLSKLQMLRTGVQPDGFELGPHLASGLTLRHYESFRDCASLPQLARRIAAESPQLDRWGIHVMAAQNQRGEVILGDSHEYDEAITPFDQVAIDECILQELRRLIRLPDWTLAERWHGVYVKHPGGVFRAEAAPGVQVVVGTGGAGMTLSFALAEESFHA